MIRPLILLMALVPGMLAAQTLYYGWEGIGMDPCTEWIGCDEGCSACNAPRSSDGLLIGAATAWMGVAYCPHAKGDGDSMVLTSGWGQQPASAQIMFDIIALQPLQVDSIIIDHQAVAGCSDRVEVSFRTAVAEGMEVVKDEQLLGPPQRTVLTQLGCVEVPEGSPYGLARLALRAYGAGDGWWLDAVRIVTSPCLSTGVATLAPATVEHQRPVMDVLGRSVGLDAAQGVYLNAQGRRVVVVR